MRQTAMTEHQKTDQRVVLSVLPGDDDAEVLVTAQEARDLRRVPGHESDEIVCASCGSDLVFPFDWENTSQTMWVVTLRCPECGAEYDEHMERWRVERFITQLHAQKRALAQELARFTRSSFVLETERFVAALQAGHIQPDDF
jgi:hypothetical protein